jgi:putative ABC transport system permease protein
MLNFRGALRSLRRSPGFFAVAVLTLVLGIGALSAIFSVVNSVLLTPLAGVDTERLVKVYERSAQNNNQMATVRAYREWQKLTDIFEEIAATQSCRPNLTGSGEPAQLYAPCVTANWFRVYGAKALFGRTFLPDEDRPGRERVAVLDYRFWQKRFGGSANVIGQMIALDRNAYTIVGVMPPAFPPLGSGNTDLYMPWVLDENAITNVIVTARLKRGVSIAQAKSALNVIAKRLEKDDPDHAGITVEVVRLRESAVGSYRELLLLLTGAAGLVLLVACVNAANLFLARGAARRGETRIRAFLGANRRQLLAPALAESAIVSVCGGGFGLLAAWAIARVLALRLQNFPRADEIHVDARVALVTLAVTVLTVFVCGMAPVLDLRRARAVLVVAEVGLTFVLLICSGLLIRSFVAMRQVDLGYNPHGVITGLVAQPEDPNDRRDGAVALRRRVRERITALPGVAAVATSSRVPFGGVGLGMSVVREGEDPNKPPAPGEKEAQMVIASSEYFRVAGIPLRAGRTFTERDSSNASAVVIVSESIANRYFEGRALGRRIMIPRIGFNLKSFDGFGPCEIVGVVGDIKENSIRDSGLMAIYLPEGQFAVRYTGIVVRAVSGDGLLLERAVRHVVFEEAPALAVNQMEPFEGLSSALIDAPRRAMWLLGLFAALALLLASVGVHGVVAYATAQRAREMGIRMALGARPSQVFGLVTRQALQLAGMGAALGVALAYACTHWLQTLLFGVGRTDPATYAMGVLLLVAIAALASFTPALRASRTDPAVTLRAE